jgi:hypothetical protein
VRAHPMCRRARGANCFRHNVLMGYDIGKETVQVLTEGLAALPQNFEPSQTLPLALWRGERNGAVLFVRLWRNGNYDSDCAITERASDGSWCHPDGWGGSGWIDGPLHRPEAGWDGDPVAWLGRTVVESEEGVVRVVSGAASKRVAGIEVEQAGRKWLHPIESQCGAFVVGVESPESATLQALDQHGQPLYDADGQSSRATL